MKKVKKFLTRVMNMDWPEIKKELDILSQKTNISKLKLVVDIIQSSFRYKTGFHDYKEFEFYLMDDAERNTFITSGLNREIVKFYNDLEYRDYFEDKSVFYKYFNSYMQRKYLDLREVTVEKFEKFIREHQKVVYKQLDEVEGFGVEVKDYQDELEAIDFLKEFNSRLKNEQFLVETYFIQDDEMAKLSVHSVNTVRIISFLSDDGDVIIMNQILKAGRKGNLDNYGQGGLYTVLSADGRVIHPFVDKAGQSYHKHPDTGFKLIGFQVPRFDEILTIVKKAAQEIPQVRYVGWDLAIGSDSVEIIEGNYYSYPFQVIPSISDKPMGMLPKYKKVMKELFEEKE